MRWHKCRETALELNRRYEIVAGHALAKPQASKISMNHDKAIRFEQLHRDGNCFIMANAWNAGSAVILEQAGFEAIGTTSAGIAYSHGLADAEAALSFESAWQETREITDAVALRT